jgi:putative methionine-R-sulfoxide reductase with GAF domain
MTESQAAQPNRRRRIRHKILTPAYASFTDESKGTILDLHEIVDLSEDGVAIQCGSLLELNRGFELCLDLAEAGGQIYTTGQVVWSNSSGRAGFRFSDLAPASALLLREWLFLNAMAGVANAQQDTPQAPAFVAPSPAPEAVRPNYSDTLAALTAVQREIESLGDDLAAALQLVARRAQTLLRASGSAIALAEDDRTVMACRASSGADAPPVGARLQVGSGFSGECVRSGKLLRCDDSETDERVDRESSRALGIRSILAAPLRARDNVIGIIEVFSPAPRFFTESDSTVLHRLADTIVSAINRAARSQDPPVAPAAPPSPLPGSVLFASQPAESGKTTKELADKTFHGISLPLSQLIVLVCAFAAISLALGFLMRPWIQEKLQANGESRNHTVLAASQPPEAPSSTPAAPLTGGQTLDQLTDLARQGSAVAQYSLGMRYNLGDGVKQDYTQAAQWFSRAADQGHVLAQGALGEYYNYGRGVPADASQAYFWSYLAFAGGDEVSKLRLGRLAGQLPHSRVLAIQQRAEEWFHGHRKPSPSR